MTLNSMDIIKFIASPVCYRYTHHSSILRDQNTSCHPDHSYNQIKGNSPSKSLNGSNYTHCINLRAHRFCSCRTITGASSTNKKQQKECKCIQIVNQVFRGTGCVHSTHNPSSQVHSPHCIVPDPEHTASPLT